MYNRYLISWYIPLAVYSWWSTATYNIILCYYRHLPGTGTIVWCYHDNRKIILWEVRAYFVNGSDFTVGTCADKLIYLFCVP